MIEILQNATPLKRHNKHGINLCSSRLSILYCMAHERSENRGNDRRPEAPVLWIFVAYTRPPCTIMIIDIIYNIDSFF